VQLPGGAPAAVITQFYDQCLAPAGIRTTVSILAKLALGADDDQRTRQRARHGSNNAGTNDVALERDGLIAVKDGISDRRSKAAPDWAGAGRVRAARKLWAQAQTVRGYIWRQRASILRNELRAVVASELGGACNWT
jgi:hypothetical protein